MNARKTIPKKSTNPLEEESVVISKEQVEDNTVVEKSPVTASDDLSEAQEASEPVQDETKVSVKKKKTAKAKVIRDSFSFPEDDYLKITELKKTCLAEGIHVKKGELLRAGLKLLANLSIDELKQAVEQVEKVKTGRPSA